MAETRRYTTMEVWIPDRVPPVIPEFRIAKYPGSRDPIPRHDLSVRELFEELGSQSDER